MDAGPSERDALLRQRIAIMPPDQFEQLVFELAHREDPEVRRLVHPDGGADTLRRDGGWAPITGLGRSTVSKQLAALERSSAVQRERGARNGG